MEQGGWERRRGCRSGAGAGGGTGAAVAATDVSPEPPHPVNPKDAVRNDKRHSSAAQRVLHFRRCSHPDILFTLSLK